MEYGRRKEGKQFVGREVLNVLLQGVIGIKEQKKILGRVITAV